MLNALYVLINLDVKSNSKGNVILVWFFDKGTTFILHSQMM